MTGTPTAGWYDDPSGRFEHRFWDGDRWTEHVGSRGHQSVDPLENAQSSESLGTASSAEAMPAAEHDPALSTDSTLWNEQVLVINQRARMVGSTASYGVFSQYGTRLGSIEELRRDFSTVVRDRMRHKNEFTRARHYRIVDPQGRVLLAMTRPEMGWFAMRGRIAIEGPGGAPLGEVVHESFGVGGGIATAAQAGVKGASTLLQLGLGGLKGAAASGAMAGVQERMDSAVEGWDKVGHARFGLESAGHRLGSINAESVKAWDFNVQDPEGKEIARITKNWAGWTKERFTKADNYVVEMHHPLKEPLRSLVIGGALAIDVELKERGSQTTKTSRRATRRYN